MRILTASLALAATTFAALPASSVEFAYQWKKGDVHRFRFQDQTTFDIDLGGVPGMPAMVAGGMQNRLEVRSEFSQKVLSVKPNGTAEVELTIERMDVFQDGQQVASLTQVPPKARVVKAEVDRKGRAKFHRTITVYMKDDQVVVAAAEVGPNSARGTASAGGKKLEVVASVDPKTGQVTASAKVTDAPPPKLTKVEIKEEDPGVDVLPKQVFELMVLPDGDLQPGGKVTVSTPIGDSTVSMSALDGSRATLRLTNAGRKVEVAAPAEEPAGEDPFGGMGGMGMGGMPGMGGSQGKKTAAPASASAGMKMDFDITSSFDVAAGRLLGLEGTTASDMSVGGTKVKTDSKFKLERR